MPHDDVSAKHGIELRQHLVEARRPGHVGVGDAVNERGGGRNGAAGIDQRGITGHRLAADEGNDGRRDDHVARGIESGRLEVQGHERSGA
jgi:hypothetical protein